MHRRAGCLKLEHSELRQTILLETKAEYKGDPEDCGHYSSRRLLFLCTREPAFQDTKPRIVVVIVELRYGLVFCLHRNL